MTDFVKFIGRRVLLKIVLNKIGTVSSIECGHEFVVVEGVAER